MHTQILHDMLALGLFCALGSWLSVMIDSRLRPGRYQPYRVVSGIADTAADTGYRPIPVGRRCNDKMPKYHVDRLISLPAAMAANGVDSSMHNQPCAIMLFTAFYNDLRPPTMCDNYRRPGAHKQSSKKFAALRRHWAGCNPPHVVTVTERGAARDVWMPHCCIRTHLSASLSSSPLDPRWRSVYGTARHGVFSRWLPGSTSDWVGISKQGDGCIECSGRSVANNIVFLAWICYRFLQYRHS